MSELFADVTSYVLEHPEVIVDIDGMASISDKVFQGGQAAPDGELAALVGEVTDGTEEESAASEEGEEERVGIYDFFDSGDLDLDDILGEVQDDSDSLAGDQKSFYSAEGKIVGVRLSETGALYDEYEAEFPARASRNLKAIMSFSRDVNAIALALITKDGDDLVFENTIGFAPGEFTEPSELDIQRLNDIILNLNVEYFPPSQLEKRLPVFAILTDRIHGALLIPARYRGEQAAFFIGLHDPIRNLAAFCAERFEI